MQVLLTQILGGVIRVALGGAMVWLIQRGIITEDQTTALVAGITTGIVTVGWIVWNKVKARREFHTGNGTGPGTTENEVKAMVAAGTFASALTKPDEVPVIKSNGTGN